MPIIARRTTRDTHEAILQSVIPDLKGDATLEPTNYEENWGFFELDEDGDPEGFEIGMPPDPTGFWVYASPADGSPKDLAAQDTAPIDLDEDSYLIQHEWIAGSSPRTTASVNLAPPEDFELRAVPQTQVGLPAGTYYISYTWLDFYEQHTTLSPPIQVTIANGQYIRVTLPTSPPSGAIGVGLWLSAPNGTVNTMRLQAVIQYVQTIPTTYLLKGPYKKRRDRPDRNETVIAQPRVPALRLVRGNGESQPGTYRARIMRVNRDANTLSVASEWSSYIEITPEDAEDHLHVEVDWQAWGSAIGKEEEADVSYRVEVERTALGVTQSYILTQEFNPLSSLPLNSTQDDNPTFSGLTAEEMNNLPTPLSGSALERAIESLGLTYGEEGLEPPTSPLDGAVPAGAALLAAGTYWVTVAYDVDGEITLPAEPQKITITASQAIRVWFPDDVNHFKNSQMRDLDATFVLDGWTLTGARMSGPGDATIGSGFFDEQGRLTLSTAGTKTTAATPDLSQAITINRDSKEIIGGKVTVTLSLGTVDITVEELSSTNSILVTHTLESVATSGEVTFKKVFGPGYTALNADTTQLRFRLKFSGASRNGTVAIDELYAHAHTRRLRRRERAALFSRQPDNANPRAIRRWAKKATKGVEPPPRTFSLFAAPSPTAFLDSMTFESGGLSSGWTLRQSSTSSTVATVSPLAAYEGVNGYRIEKNTTGTRYVYLHRTYAENRTAMAVRAPMRVRQLPKGYTAVVQIKTAQADEETNQLAALRVRSDGRMQVEGTEFASDVYRYQVGTGLSVTDLADFELRVSGANSSNGKIEVWYGKNGATRTKLYEIGGWHWSGKYAKTAMIGPSEWVDPKDTCQFDFDSIYVTETGFSVAPTLPPALKPLPLPDRPRKPAVVEETIDFEGGTIPASLQQVRTPISATTLATQSGIGISGTYALRVADANTATAPADIYVRKSYGGTVASKGIKARYRIVARPTGGSQIRLMRIVGTGNVTLAYFYLTDTGALYARSATANGTLLNAVQVAQSIANGTVLTLELVAQNVGGATGNASYWVSIGGTGAISERQLMWLDQNIDWSGASITAVDVGSFGESVLASTSTLDIDDISITEAGEIVYDEFSQDGREINGAHAYYPPGTPVTDDKWLKGWRKAITPGKAYEVGVRHAHFGVDNTCHPYYFSAYDTQGKEYPLGSLLNGGLGGTGDLDWADHTREFTIPADCYEVRMESRNIGAGEFVCQSFFWGPSGIAEREVYYPASQSLAGGKTGSGLFYAILDTHPPEKPVNDNVPVNNTWISAATLLEVPEGCTVEEEYQASNSQVMPNLWSSSPSNLIPARFLHVRYTLNTDSTRRKTPKLLSGTPYIDTWSSLHGVQAAAFLRDDLSEFSGGCYALGDIMFPRMLAEYDSHAPRGRITHHRRTDRIGRMPGPTLRCFSEKAIAEIEENWTLDFCIEYRDRRAMVRLQSPPEFSETGDIPTTKDPVTGYYVGEFETSLDELEVVSVAPMISLAGPVVA